MVNLQFDSYFIACPSIDEGKEAFEEYTYRLLDWQSSSSNKSIKFYFSHCSINTLLANNKYPFWDDLKNGIKAYDIDYIQDKDLNIIAESILKRSLYIEDDLKIKEALFGDVLLTPHEILGSRNKAFQTDFLNTLSLMALYCIINELPNTNFFIVSKNVNEVHSLTRIETSLQMCDPEGALEIKSLPYSFTFSFKVISEFKELLKNLDDGFLMISSNNVSNLIAFAIQSHTFKVGIEANLISKIDEIREWYFGSKFIETCKFLGFLSEERKAKTLLKAISEVLLDLNQRSVHSLRTGSGGDNPQRRRGTFSAWRKDIDYEYHLHYWKCGPLVEFASVVIHSDMSIPN